MNEYMEEALKEAYQGINHSHGGPFVKDGKIIGRGHNQVVKNQDPTCHGEIMAIHDACKNMNSFDLSGSEIYTTGYPCPMCLGAILWANISKVYYGCNTIDTEKIGFRDQAFYDLTSDEKKMNEFVKEMDREECLKLYEDYLKKGGRTAY